MAASCCISIVELMESRNLDLQVAQQKRQDDRFKMGNNKSPAVTQTVDLSM